MYVIYTFILKNYHIILVTFNQIAHNIPVLIRYNIPNVHASRISHSMTAIYLLSPLYIQPITKIMTCYDPRHLFINPTYDRHLLIVHGST